uniref:Uncharacterized protein n=1 Tax=Gasterosteus aculeatus aculeatus TaxID=481459 RepID=A0AAQ4PU19_GASAC|nr:uncharacterized protein LOC120831330 isoform X1 [Gasterosteus aculeatus aculeatus]
MSLQAVVLALFVCFHAFSSSPSAHPSDAKQSGCFKVNNCKCIMKDGSGVINLRATGDADGFLGRWKPVSTEVLLSFSPCQPFSQPEDLTGTDCTDVAACLIVRLNGHTGHYVSYGRHDGNQFHYNDTTKTLSVSYLGELKHNHRRARLPSQTALSASSSPAGEDEQPLTVVHYHCSPNRSASVVSQLSLGAEQPLHMWVESPCACPNYCAMGDLGVGTIFLIILSLSAAAYFILGSCALRPFRSSSGVQISPERSVWCMICYHCTESRPARRRYADPTH